MLSQQASSRKDPDSEREVFRSAGSTVLSWAWFVVAVIILVDLAVQGRDHAAVVTAVLVLAITGVVYACAWRPKIVADSGGITVINPVRDHQVPWTAVRQVDVVNAVRVHCEPAPGTARGRVLYSWAVQSSPRSARKAALRREAHSQPRPRLTPRPRVLQPPASTAPRGYGELPDSAKEALERSSAEFTAGRLAERAQHARQAAARASGLSPTAGGQATAGGPAPASAPPAGGPPPAGGSATAAGPVPAGEQAGTPAAQAGPPDPWFANATDEAVPVVEQTGTPAADSPAPGPGAAAGGQSMATAQPVAQWAWLPIAAMVVPLAVLLLVVLV
ncbi:MAG TPA: PH domain-containing protein [Streptosporangiaceae bacterium]|nr:PH domain-containing protein [Streptosporangiaceae bacterium]